MQLISHKSDDLSVTIPYLRFYFHSPKTSFVRYSNSRMWKIHIFYVFFFIIVFCNWNLLYYWFNISINSIIHTQCCALACVWALINIDHSLMKWWALPPIAFQRLTSLVFLCATRPTAHAFLRRISVMVAGLPNREPDFWPPLPVLIIHKFCLLSLFHQKLCRGKGSSSGMASLTGRVLAKKMMMVNDQLSVGHVPKWNNLGGCVSRSHGLKGYDLLQCLTKWHIKMQNTVPMPVQKSNHMQIFSFIHLIKSVFFNC